MKTRFYHMCQCMLVLFFLSGCVGFERGILVYDLANNRVVSFIGQCDDPGDIWFIQCNTNGNTFLTFDMKLEENASRSVTRKSTKRETYISERNIKGEVVSRRGTSMFPPHVPLWEMAVSPNGEHVAVVETTERRESPRTSLPIQEIKIMTSDGTLLKIVAETEGGFNGKTPQLFWLSDDVIITRSVFYREKITKTLIKYDLKADEATRLDYSFAIFGYPFLPSPNGRYVLLNRSGGDYVDVLDSETMTIVYEAPFSLSCNFTWLSNEDFLVWTHYEDDIRIIRYNLPTKQVAPVQVGFSGKKYGISTFVGDHFILYRLSDCSQWSYNVKTGLMHKIVNKNVGTVLSLNDSTIIFDRAELPRNIFQSKTKNLSVNNHDLV